MWQLLPSDLILAKISGNNEVTSGFKYKDKVLYW
jgi:hypothetical protein